MRWLTQLSACGCFFCLGTIYLLWPTPQAELWQCMAEPFHQLIAPYPLSATLCEVTAPENTIPDNGTYQIKLRIVSVIYGHSDAPIPPLSGYVSDYQEFMDGIEGDVRCNNWVLPSWTIKGNATSTFSASSHCFKVRKSNGRFQLNYITPAGSTFSQEFDLPEGEVFATNLGDHPKYQVRVSANLPWLLSFLKPFYRKQETLRTEMFLLVTYHELPSPTPAATPYRSQTDTSHPPCACGCKLH